MTLEQQSKWLRISGDITILFGVLTALAAYPPLNGFIIFLADMLVWPIDGLQTGLDSTARLMLAIGGGIFTAFGVMWWMLSGDIYRQNPQAIRRVLLIGAVTWFVTDSAASVLADAASNVLGNIGFLALLIWPIIKPASNSLATA